MRVERGGGGGGGGEGRSASKVQWKLDITNLYITKIILRPSNNKIYGKETRYNEHIFPSLGSSLYRGSTVIILRRG